MAVDPPFRIKNMMPGMIMLWYGAYADIPSGWTLCDGNNGTPDLRGKFVRGAGTDGYPVGSTGGSVGHNHTFTGDGHTHALVAGANIPVGANWANSTTSVPATGTTDNKDELPPYHTLCYIMKLP